MFWLSRSTLGDFRKSCGELPPSATETRLLQITFPRPFAAQLANCALRKCFQKQPETRFYDRSLGTGAAAAHGLMHQLVIDLDIGSHEGGLSMCKRLIFVCIRSNRKDRHSPCVDRRGLHSLNSHNVFN